MKKKLTKFLLFNTLCVLVFVGCKKNDAIVTSNGGTPSVLTASTTSPNLNKATLTATAITFTATIPVFNFNAVATNTLQIDIKGNNFASPKESTIDPKAPTVNYNVADLNNFLLGRKQPAGVPVQLEARVKVSLSTDVVASYSNVISFTATPFNLASWLYVVGGFNSYSTATADSILSPTSNGIYTGIINFTTGGNRFLVLPARNYNNKYATNTSPPTTPPASTAMTLTYATVFVTGGGNDLYAPSTPGYYLITLNINTNTITVTQTNTYSAIGTTAADAGGYSIDVPLNKYVNDGVTGWTSVLPIAFRTGDFKIRQNNDWSFSWGIPKSGSDGFGIANTLNDTMNTNIPIAVAGNYAVSFNIIPFALTLPASASAPPMTTGTTATYKLVKM